MGKGVKKMGGGRRREVGESGRERGVEKRGKGKGPETGKEMEEKGRGKFLPR